MLKIRVLKQYLIYQKAFKVILLILSIFVCTGSAHASEQEDIAWQALKSGEAVAFMRHADAPDTNQVSPFNPQKCAEERNISAKGAAQARAISAKLRANKITKATVYSSYLCRCVDTGMLLQYGDVLNLSEINTYYENRSKGPSQTEALRQWIKDSIKQKKSPIVLVTHGLNITDLMGDFAQQGDVLIIGVENDKLVNLYQLNTPL